MKSNACLILGVYCLLLGTDQILLAQHSKPLSAIKLEQQILELHQQGNYKDAVPLAHQLLTIRREAFGPEHPSVAKSLNDLGVLYYAIGDYVEVETLYQQALEIWQNTTGVEHSDAVTCLSNLAELYRTLGNYSASESLNLQVLAIREETLGADDPQGAAALNNLGLLYYSMGLHTKAEPLFLRALRILENNLGPKHPDVALVLNDLAALYRTMGFYNKSKDLSRRALTILEEYWGPDHLELAEPLTNLAILYHSIGSFAEAEPLLRRAYAIRERALKPAHPDMANSLNNLAGLYLSAGHYATAESLYLHSVAIFKEALGPECQEVARALSNLAALYEKMGAFTEAESLYLWSLEILKKRLGSENPNVSIVLNNLGGLYFSTGEYKKAEHCIQEAFTIQEKTMGPAHPNLVLRLDNLSELWLAMGKIDSVLSNAERIVNLKLRLYLQILPYLAEAMQLDFIKSNPPLTSFWPALYLNYGDKYPELGSRASEMTINSKGLISEILTARTRGIKNETQNIASIMDRLNDIGARLANFYISGPTQGRSFDQYEKDLVFLSGEKQRLEDTLAAKGYAPAMRESPVTALQVSNALPEDYVLVDFWYFREHVFAGKKQAWGKWRYLASVFQAKQGLRLIDLGDANPIHKNIAELRSIIHDITTTRRSNTETIFKKKAKKLWQQLFRPLLPALGEKKKVIICADGLLHYLPFGIMVDKRDRYLVESYQFYYVPTSRGVLQWSKNTGGEDTKDKNLAIIIADPQFDFMLTETVLPASSSKSVGIEFSDRRSRDWRQIGFSQLKYTGPEAVAIDSLLKQKGITTKLYLQDQAQEAVLKSVVSPQILHISTHGFFLPDQPEIRRPKEIGGFSSIGEFDRMPAIENPLLRCGLAFAGANHAESVKEGEDGLATAMEIAGLDLQGTDLVTLSACLTGVGELRSGEGVYGLHRSFLLAGAKTVLASLWSVPDLETKDLMVEFYRRYLFGENISKSEALRQAQLAVIEQLRKKYGAAHPAYWGAFVCIGEP